MIEGSIQSRCMKKFKNEIQEGEVFIVSQFGVSQNTSNFRATRHTYKIMFHMSTMFAKQVDDADIPRYGIQITPANAIYDSDTNLNYLVGTSI